MNLFYSINFYYHCKSKYLISESINGSTGRKTQAIYSTVANTIELHSVH